MPTRIIKSYKRGKVSVQSYKQKYKEHRGPEPKAKDKKPRSLRAQKRTEWLMDKGGKFTGRSGKDGETTSTKHVISGKDFTGTVVDKFGRIYGRYKSKAGKERYNKEIKKAHPRSKK